MSEDLVIPVAIGEIGPNHPAFAENPLDCIGALAIAMEELAIAQALVIVHGPEHGAKKYLDTGGRVRFDAKGQPTLLWHKGMTSRI